MKTIIFSHDSNLSGANLSLFDWLSDIGDRQDKHIVIIPKYNKNFIDKFKKIGVSVVVGHYVVRYGKANKRNIIYYINDFIKRVYSTFYNYFIYNFIAYKIRKMGDIDVIMSNSFATTAGAEVASRLKKPHVWHIREFMEEDHRITHLSPRKVKRFCEKSSAIYISDVIAEKYAHKYNFLNSKIIYNKVQYDDSYKKERSFFQAKHLNCIMVGTLSKNKRQIEAIQCVEKLIADGILATLTICGSGLQENELKNYVRKNNLTKYIDFTGNINNVTELRKTMDVAFVCSTNEALGRVTVEASYYENLIIGSRNGFTPYIVKDKKTGLLYEQGNIDDMVNCIKFAIENMDQTKEMIKFAKNDAIKKFSKNIASKIEEYLEYCSEGQNCE